MKRKTIKKILNMKFEEFAKSITDSNVKKLVEKNTIITGGSIASMFLGEPIYDFDLYFKNKETVLAVAHYYTKIFNETRKDHQMAEVVDGARCLEKYKDEEKRPFYLHNMTSDRVKIYVQSNGVTGDLPDEEDVDEVRQALSIMKDDAKKKDPYQPIFLSPNAITLSDDIQLIIRFYGNPEEIHKNYDFIHATNYWESNNKKLTTSLDAMESLISKELRYTGSLYPVCSVFRTRKFINRQWTINAGQYLKMCFQVSQLDLTDLNVLEDQLFGVDVSYFATMVEVLRAKQAKDSSFVMSDGYLATIIDRIF